MKTCDGQGTRRGAEGDEGERGRREEEEEEEDVHNESLEVGCRGGMLELAAAGGFCTGLAADSEAEEEMVLGSGGPGTAAATVPCKLSAAIAEPKSLDFMSRGDILLGSGRTKVAMET